MVPAATVEELCSLERSYQSFSGTVLPTSAFSWLLLSSPFFSEGDQVLVFTPLELGAPWWVPWLGFLALLVPDLPKVIPRAFSLLCISCLVAWNLSSPSPWFLMGHVRNKRLFLLNVSCDSKLTKYRKIIKSLLPFRFLPGL